MGGNLGSQAAEVRDIRTRKSADGGPGSAALQSEKGAKSTVSSGQPRDSSGLRHPE